MSADSFERLVVSICVELLGPSVQPFSTGPDGGRDARFVGTAERFPSESSPISGRFVIQAKHTEHPFAKFSDSDFASDADTSTLSKEIPRITSLVDASELEVYFLFSNRRLAGVADHEIRDRVTQEAGTARVELFGVERMDLLLRKFPEIARTADIKLLSAPLLISPDDLAEVICALDRDSDAFATAVQSIDHLERVPFAKKNTDNGLTPEFAKEIRSKYMPNFDTVRRFLAQPGNEVVVERYRDAASELHEQILAHRADYDSFDRVLVRLAGLLFDRDGDLARRKRLTKLVLYYMYWNCDIGVVEDAETA